jgi:hypothetical protein
VNETAKRLPKSVDQAVERLTSELSLTEKSMIANMSEEELIDLQFTLGDYIRKEFRLDENYDLMESCRSISKADHINIGHAEFKIILELWKKLQTIFIFTGTDRQNK